MYTSLNMAPFADYAKPDASLSVESRDIGIALAKDNREETTDRA
jgi:hypothetical protein